MKTYLDNLIEENIFNYVKTCGLGFAIKVKLEGEKITRIFNPKEVARHIENETIYGKYFKDIIIDTVCEVIKLKGKILQKSFGEESRKIDILHEKIENTSFGKDFLNRSVSLAIFIFFGCFIKK